MAVAAHDGAEAIFSFKARFAKRGCQRRYVTTGIERLLLL
jgi:hypothetical protein